MTIGHPCLEDFRSRYSMYAYVHPSSEEHSGATLSTLRLLAFLCLCGVMLLVTAIPAFASSDTEARNLSAVSNDGQIQMNTDASAVFDSSFPRTSATATLTANLISNILRIDSVPVTSKEAQEYKDLQILTLTALAVHASCVVIPLDNPTFEGVGLMLACLEPVNAAIISASNRSNELFAQLLGLTGPPLTPLTPEEIAAGSHYDAGTLRATANMFRIVASGAQDFEELLGPLETFNNLRNTRQLFKNLSDLPDNYKELISIAPEATQFNANISAAILSPYFGTILGSGLNISDTHQFSQSSPGSTDGAYPELGKALNKLFAGAEDKLQSNELLVQSLAEFRSDIQQLQDGVIKPGYAALQASGVITDKGNAIAATIQSAQLSAFSESLFASFLMHQQGATRGLEAYNQASQTGTQILQTSTASLQAITPAAASGPSVPTQEALEVGLVKAGAPLTVTVDDGAFFLQVGTQHQVNVTEATSGAPVTDAVFMPLTTAPGFTVSPDGVLSVASTDSPFANVPAIAWIMVKRNADWGIAQVAILDSDEDSDLLGSAWERQQGLNPNIPDDAFVTVARIADDDDNVPFASDNCPSIANADQADADQDGLGDVCDANNTHDTTPPTLVCPSNITLIQGQPINLGSPTVSDIVDTTPTVSNNAPSSFPIGTTVVNWTATDQSGNQATCQQTVKLIYNFQGFFQPVDNLPVTNTVKNGSTVPVKWRLLDANGSYITDTSSFINSKYTQSSCGGTADAIEETTATTGGTELRWDSTAQQFVYNWKTPALAGKCIQLVLTFNDGVSRTANFQLK